MNKLNDIFKMISEMEKNAEEVKLGTHQVELAIPDQLIAVIKNSKTLDSKFDELQKLYVKYNVEGNILLKETKANLIKLEQEDARISKLVKELGMNPNELPYLKESGNAYSILAKIVDMLQTNLK
jgi:hypothetical protein